MVISILKNLSAVVLFYFLLQIFKKNFVSRKFFEFMKTKADEFEAKLKDISEQNFELKIELAKKDEIVKNLEESRENANLNSTKINETFENLANKILIEKTKFFLDENNNFLNMILSPFKENIKKFEEKIENYFVAESQEKSNLKHEIKNLFEFNRKISDEANNLASALKSNVKIQGNWGESQLERILEISGLQKGINYELQQNFTTDENHRLQPDCIVKLTDQKILIIDAKVSLIAYEKYFSATEEVDKKTYLKEHVDSIYSHIDNLSKKNYPSIGLKNPDFVFMFVPIESALVIATHFDMNLFEYALNKSIILTPASTLVPALRTIAHIWKQEDLRRNFLEITKTGADLYNKMSGFVGDVEDIGKHLALSQKSYESAINKLTKSARKSDTIIAKAEKLKSLGIQTDKTISKNLLDLIDESEEKEIFEE